ncbi:cytochrome c3 family protein [Afifella sp. H1R]|uniref:cytochrome c3 family protein n=1 Tax=Afifella sp. H1R TaxID=2908841 RepID=UPI001F2F54AE|nr:cytochrome c3 family protein [Afifella sp. H1R]MCF1505932.1 cytochrome c3 family protein [Afifella sp. H1R]
MRKRTAVWLCALAFLATCSSLLGGLMPGEAIFAGSLVASSQTPQERLAILVPPRSNARLLAPVEVAFLDALHQQKGVTCENCHGAQAPTSPATDVACRACHGSYADLAARTSVSPNPHASHLGEIDCTECHKAHSPSTLFCSVCHQFPTLVMPSANTD